MRAIGEARTGRADDPYAPLARAIDVVVTETAGEVLVYDTTVHHIHHLNEPTAVIWRLCDGRRSVVDLVRLARLEMDDGVDEAVVRQALTKLDDANLLAEPLEPGLRLKAASRRSLMKKAALASTIVSISAPAAAMAGSTETCSHNASLEVAGRECNQHAQCCSGVCVQDRPFALGVCA